MTVITGDFGRRATRETQRAVVADFEALTTFPTVEQCERFEAAARALGYSDVWIAETLVSKQGY